MRRSWRTGLIRYGGTGFTSRFITRSGGEARAEPMCGLLELAEHAGV
jgi:hypothetical protein